MTEKRGTVEERDGLSPARGCLFALVIGLVLWALIIGAIWGVVSLIRHQDSRTVPAEVLTDRMGALDVQGIAEDEIAHIRRQFTLPPFTLGFLDRMGTGGNTVVSTEPARYTVALWTVYYTEPQLRKVTAHELAHVLFAERGLVQSEERADLFAACFGSDMARQYAREWAKPTGSCDELKTQLTGRP